MLAELGRLLRAVADGPDPASLPAPGDLLAVLDLLGSPEFDYPRGARRYCGTVSEGAAANRQKVGIFNPADSGALAVVDRMDASIDSEYLYVCLFRTQLTDQDGTTQAMDVRAIVDYTGTGPSPACSIDSETSVGTKGVMGFRWFPQSDDGTTYRFTHNQPWVLFPGWGLIINPVLDNKQLDWSVFWTERGYDEKELAGVLDPSKY